MGGYKIFLDGSPQGRTAWLREPYLKGDAGYRGYPIYSDHQVRQMLAQAIADQGQILCHCNGDAAAEQMIRAYEEAGGKNLHMRPVMIHAQLVGQDQLKKMADLSMIASFFIAHTYHWGDVHLQNFGSERAMRISPAASAKKSGSMLHLPPRFACAASEHDGGIVVCCKPYQSRRYSDGRR